MFERPCKATLIFCVCSIAVACAEQPGQMDRAGDEAAIRAQIAATEAAWNERSAPALAALYAPDGDVMMLAGLHISGQDAIRRAAEDGSFFPTEPTSTRRISLAVDRIRFLTSEVAIVGASARFTAGEPVETAPTYVMVRQEGAWRIAALRGPCC